MNVRGGLTALAALVLGACGPSQISLSIKSPVGTNMGRPLYMLVRQVDPKQYANEAYSEVAARVGVPDETVLQTSVIYPGTVQRFQVKAPKAGSVAVSFLFTAPDGNWQLLLSPPLTRSVDVELATSRILRESSARGDEGEDEAPAASEEKAPAAPAVPEGFKLPELPNPLGGGKK
ncbi:hypothetical protein [Melittangium boletus]|uniref:Type VI lipoprotein IgE-like C-terminal domain-containing protein n=1 Tax=Melittangium boletus DSM 14713 TaxID=1294270 RepID=A0A250IQF7_9BACT|nr:hypothetical protein [Melittangium boletus]ATB33985.1 hypothetical protein MEBOL_007486 [Melittangium boletus DSM 14713]